MDILPVFGNLAFTIAAFVAAISVIVAVHEYGHYIVGRWSGIRAEVFSLGFGPVVFARKDRRGTVWQIAALPFGGYVKFAGDANAASVGAAQGTVAVNPRETMAGAPLWARAATVAAGPLANFILSAVIFAAVFIVTGRASEEARVGDLRPLPPSYATLAPDDLILSIEGQGVENLAALFDLAADLPPRERFDYIVTRDGRDVAVTASHPMPPIVDGVAPQSAAQDADLRAGDVILAVDGVEIFTFAELRAAVDRAQGAPLHLTVWRAEIGVFDITLAPRSMDLPLPEGGFETRYLIGVTGGLLFEPMVEPFGVFSALTAGAGQVGSVIQNSLSGLWHMVTGAISRCNLQGPIGIAETSGDAAAQGLDSFIWLIAVLSTAVGMMNLFPIPILDGGHLVMHAVEAVTGRAPSDRVLRVLMSIGLTILMGLMFFALFNDLFCP